MMSRRISRKEKPFSTTKPTIFSALSGRLSRFWAKRKRNKSGRILTLPKINSQLARIVLFIVLSLIFIIPLVSFIFPNVRGFYSIKFEKEVGDNREKKQEWKGEKRLNILLIGLDRKTEEYAFVDELAILALDPEKKVLGVFIVNPNIEIFLPSQGKSYTLKKLYNVGRLEDNPISLDLIVEGVEELVSVRIDRYLSVDKDDFVRAIDVYGDIEAEVSADFKDEDIVTGDEVFEMQAGKTRLSGTELVSLAGVDALGQDTKFRHQWSIIKGLVLSLDELDKLYEVNNVSNELIQNVRSDLSGSEFRRFIWSTRQVAFDGIKFGMIEENSLIKLDDGGVAPIMERVDEDVAEVFFNIDVQREQARIEVLNGTALGGLGTRKARWISNAGAKVINVGNSRENFTETTIYTPEPEKYPNTIDEIENIFGTEVVIIEGEFPYRHTGDIVLVIGENGAN